MAVDRRTFLQHATLSVASLVVLAPRKPKPPPAPTPTASNQIGALVIGTGRIA